MVLDIGQVTPDSKVLVVREDEAHEEDEGNESKELGVEGQLDVVPGRLD